MKKNFYSEAKSLKSKYRLYLFGCTLALATLSLSACNNKGKGDTTTHDDTSSTVSGKVDTTGNAGTKQP